MLASRSMALLAIDVCNETINSVSRHGAPSGVAINAALQRLTAGRTTKQLDGAPRFFLRVTRRQCDRAVPITTDTMLDPLGPALLIRHERQHRLGVKP